MVKQKIFIDDKIFTSLVYSIFLLLSFVALALIL
jgi:hypothetical protein